MSVQRIDSHQHFWRLARGDYAWLTPGLETLYRDFEPADLLPLLTKHGIAGTIAVQAAMSVAESEHLLALAGEHAWILGVVGWVDFRASDAAASIARLRAQGRLVGLRPMLQDLEPGWILDARCAPALEYMEREGLCFDALVRPQHLADIAALLRRHPRLRVVIDHAAKPDIAAAGAWSGLARWRRELAELAGLGACVKLSGLLTEAGAGAGRAELKPYVDTLLESFGPQRILWGSDWPVLGLACGYSPWVELTQELLRDVPTPGRDAVLGLNARHFYQLP